MVHSHLGIHGWPRCADGRGHCRQRQFWPEERQFSLNSPNRMNRTTASSIRTASKAAYITKARVQMMRDMGAYPTANAAFLLNLGLETLPVRMDRHCSNALKGLLNISKNPKKVEFVNYPGLEGDKYHELAKKYLPLGTCGVISLSIEGSRENAIKFMDSLKLASNEVHVADIRTCVLHPASSTHRQLTDEQLAAAGITPGLIRFSVGLENVDDIIEDIEQALATLNLDAKPYTV